MDRQGLALEHGRMQGLGGINMLVIGQQDFGRVGLGVGVDQQHALAFAGNPGSERYGGGGLPGATLLGCNSSNHGGQSHSKPARRVLLAIPLRVLCHEHMTKLASMSTPPYWDTTYCTPLASMRKVKVHPIIRYAP